MGRDLGQVGYEAFLHARGKKATPWAELAPDEQNAWRVAVVAGVEAKLGRDRASLVKQKDA
jgi:hypothetical protein